MCNIFLAVIILTSGYFILSLAMGWTIVYIAFSLLFLLHFIFDPELSQVKTRLIFLNGEPIANLIWRAQHL